MEVTEYSPTLRATSEEKKNQLHSQPNKFVQLNSQGKYRSWSSFPSLKLDLFHKALHFSNALSNLKSFKEKKDKKKDYIHKVNEK